MPEDEMSQEGKENLFYNKAIVFCSACEFWAALDEANEARAKAAEDVGEALKEMLDAFDLVMPVH